jgi:hypothetical protein
MKKYQYQILRYVHDQFTGEFVNLGVILYSPDSLFLKTIISNKYGRITALFPNANGKFISRLLKNFEASVRQIDKQLTQLFTPSENLITITKSILPPDDSALILTEVKYGIDIDLEIALNDLYNNLVEKYMNLHQERSLTDEEVWRKKYKAYFDKYALTHKLTTHEVVTNNDSFSFDKSWKNEIWHCYQPVSFDLQNTDSIKDKVYRWSGILHELSSANEKIHITFLTTLSTLHKDLNDFIMKSLDQDSSKIEIDVISEEYAEKFVKNVSLLMQEHEHELTS